MGVEAGVWGEGLEEERFGDGWKGGWPVGGGGGGGGDFLDPREVAVGLDGLEGGEEVGLWGGEHRVEVRDVGCCAEELAGYVFELVEFGAELGCGGCGD